jgi:hypothetical protein
MKTMWRATAEVTVVVAAILTTGVSARAQEPKSTAAGGASAEQVIGLTPAELQWTAGPPMLPPGASMAVIEGSFSKPGPFTVRLKFPANYRIPPHWHPVKVTVTVISGSFNMGFGDELDLAKERCCRPAASSRCRQRFIISAGLPRKRSSRSTASVL